ncbi:uncharacterized protein CCOS01_05294 [Colletotrichum costaricense]|uniref:Uncharacterized protein n=1 Tax=Colletotrichum costaricense TaxID=1209916 RepID=A0AAI9Z081_9PEZI|nr:uncharacterized protein CCOS01_05294 [Colletotrichum costaricense]KAK1530191.1 hypothetical protein CCOS01_05294 [Colletotrichum costaricense]
MIQKFRSFEYSRVWHIIREVVSEPESTIFGPRANGMGSPSEGIEAMDCDDAEIELLIATEASAWGYFGKRLLRKLEKVKQ